jgi:hypothetical protein
MDGFNNETLVTTTAFTVFIVTISRSFQGASQSGS